MDELSKLEKEQNLTLPVIYKKFYKRCKKSTPKEIVGTDLFNDRKELKEWALELLKEDNTNNFLSDKDFVFMMHQGYMFWYFKADGAENPDVYFYREMGLKPDRLTDLRTFLSKY
ncbi:SMI1/KNR4 family protein [Aquimarina sp. D1M17]|uniref:SMI1/KNR4 family protein n=1 Tax=Aquimarina acroporae TaxID=2937283 RepID=UPI0020BFBD7E|nr:SMI1/KNR4 family protein [Aquimarina acroporae]MCK8520401.1 SMI1/KNR4 family protein [Aquimarina acroporae]